MKFLYELYMDLFGESQNPPRKGGNMTDLTDLIERTEGMEERLGFTFKGLFAGLNNKGELTVNGELHAIEGREPDCSVMVVISLQDAPGRVIAVSREYVYIKDFYIFKTFSRNINLSEFSGLPAKIRIYPEKC